MTAFRTACQDHQAGESAVKCLSQGHNRMAQVGFEPRPAKLLNLVCAKLYLGLAALLLRTNTFMFLQDKPLPSAKLCFWIN